MCAINARTNTLLFLTDGNRKEPNYYGHADHVMLSMRSHILANPLGMLFMGAQPTNTNRPCLDEQAVDHPKCFDVHKALTMQTCKLL